MRIWNNQLRCVESAYGYHPLGFPRGEAVSHDGSSEPAGLTDEGWRGLKKFEDSTLNGKNRSKYHSSSCICEPTCRRPSSVFFANRFRSAACQKIQLPPGGSQAEVAGAGTIHCTHLFRERWGAKSPYHLQIVYSCNRPAGSKRSLDDPEGLCYNMSTERALPIDGLLPLCVTKK